MRNAAPRILIALALLTNALAVTSANPVDRPPVDGTGYVDAPEPAQYVCPTPDALNVIDRTCSTNDSCGGAEAWRGKTTDTSSGHVGGTDDPEDWSLVELHRTETLVIPTITHGFLVQQGGMTCTPSLTDEIYAQANGWYSLRVSSSVHARYELTYSIHADDALSGKDAGATPGDAWFINALPRASIVYTGSLPNRVDQPLGPDHDWYRIGTSLAAVPEPTHTEGPTIGLLTVAFNPDCYGGRYLFGLYREDTLTPIGSVLEGCTYFSKSCITAGLMPVHAQMAVIDGAGTGYDFTAELVPHHLVNLDDGVPRPRLDPSEPWCDGLTGTVLEAAGGWGPGTNLGVVNRDGVVIASVRTT